MQEKLQRISHGGDNRVLMGYCKTTIFHEHLIFAQIHEGVGQGDEERHSQVKMAITSLIMVRFSKLKSCLAAYEVYFA